MKKIKNEKWVEEVSGLSQVLLFGLEHRVNIPLKFVEVSVIDKYNTAFKKPVKVVEIQFELLKGVNDD
jgi:hypothetical protein